MEQFPSLYLKKTFKKASRLVQELESFLSNLNHFAPSLTTTFHNLNPLPNPLRTPFPPLGVVFPMLILPSFLNL